MTGPTNDPRRTVVAVLLLALGCSARTSPVAPGRAPFRFPADAFAFANETIWEYGPDPASGHVGWYRPEPRPVFVLRCGALARAARQFYAAARFDPDAPALDEATYARLVRAVLQTDPRRPPPSPIVIPGYTDLRSFSAAHERLVRAALPGPRPSYLQRGNWRMIFPFSARHQAAVADRLLESLARGWPPIVHVLRFPRITINHVVLVYAAEETPTRVRFEVYDPNDAARPVVLSFDRVTRTFSYARTRYFPGGPVNVYEIYDGALY